MKEPFLKNLMHHKLHVKTKGKDIKFKDRSCINKIQRIFYRFIRLFYASIFFYFFPYLLVLINFYSKYIENDDE